ncbi:sigma-70 family RNA polymerase sigma factor [Mycobacterium sp. TNTM28]|uniref:Sigma-70 family RNA polymerase sigma factor n=1 Tax=[Mycobacterium] fortunisiensis TaxID=2600579 RepID=A0ABS6KT75_9MYCO|nr:sigma-70 family RNA polymerase sigma factor [[Mycobacterium] fortunisiensis]MBU9766719.1 sigma-70 family RNA polymerase sigma factor [[Mycobacterium] fortunisiensis]
MANRPRRRRLSAGRQARGADDRLLTALYTDHGAAVRRFVAGHVVDVQQREDVVQETFARAWKNIDQIDATQGNPRSFLFTVAHNVIVDQWRRRSRRSEVLVDTDTDLGTAITPPSPDAVNKSLERIVIGESLQRLSPEHREVVKALYFDDLTLAEAAERLNVAVGTVKSRSYYAVRALRSVFDEMGLL